MSHSPARPEILAAVTELLGSWNGVDEPFLDASRSADAVEVVGRAVAEAVRSLAPDTLLTWADSGNAVLAHVVSRELGVRATPFIMEEGVIDVDGELIRGRRVVLVVGQGAPLRLSGPLPAYVAAQQGTLAGIVEAVGTPGAMSDPAIPRITVVDQAELSTTSNPGDRHAH